MVHEGYASAYPPSSHLPAAVLQAGDAPGCFLCFYRYVCGTGDGMCSTVGMLQVKAGQGSLFRGVSSSLPPPDAFSGI